MTERDALIHSIASRIAKADEDSGAAAHDPAAEREADELLAGYLVTPDGIDPEVQYTLGLLYLLRAVVTRPEATPREDPALRGEAAVQDDTAGEPVLALALLAPFYMNPPGAPDVLSPQVRSILDRIPGYGPRPADDTSLGQAHAIALNDLGMLLIGLRVVTGQLAQTRAAVALLREATARLDAGSPARALAQCNLGYALLLGDPGPGEVTEAVGELRESFGHTPPGNPNYARCANGLGLALMAASAAAEDRETLAEAIGMLRIAAESAPDGTPNLPQILSDLGFALTKHAASAAGGQAADPGQSAGTTEAAEAAEAVRVLTRAADLYPEDAPQRPQVLLRLAEALIEADRPGEVSELLVANQALFPGDGPLFEAAGQLMFHATMRQTQMKLRADPSRQAARARHQEFIDSAAKEPGNPLNAAMRLVGLVDGADRSKDADLMKLGAAILDADTTDPYQILRIQAMANELLNRRFEDLPEEEREQARQDYLTSIREEDSGPPTLFTPLDPSDAAVLDELLGFCERLLPELDADSRERVLVAMSARQLRMVRTVRGPLAEGAADLRRMEEVIVPMMREMMESAREDLPRFGVSPDRLLAHVSFSRVSASPFETLALAEESVREMRRRLAGLTPGTPEHDDARAILAIRLFSICGITNSGADLAEARAIARDLVTTNWPPSPVMLGMWCQREAARLGPATSLLESEEASGQSQHVLARHASSEAARDLATRDATGALETLEEGRAWMLSSAINTRGDLDILREADADAYARLLAVRDEITRGYRVQMLSGRLPTEEESVESARLMAEGGRLVEELSQRPGFDRFLLPVKMGLADLRPAAADGPVITVNVHPRRCDALVLTRDGARPVTVPLAGLTAGDVAEQAEGFRAAVGVLAAGPGGPAAGAAARVFDDVLRWLWDELAGPVLDAIGFRGQPPPGMPWPRVWWSPTGLLNAFPLHAAGHHDKPGASVLDRAISSYTPTIRALLRSQAQAARARQVRHVVAVAMPETAGHAPLTQTASEAGAAAFHGGSRLTGPDAVRQDVLAALPGSSIAHFACHASSDPGDLTASYLLLHDGVLTLGDVARLRLEGAELAYLSACGTSRSGTKLADEALHLASAFQLAGYSQSVATLWEVGDAFAAVAAAGFYRELAPALRAPVPLPAATALHATVRSLRDSHRAQPWAWSALVHAGA